MPTNLAARSAGPENCVKMSMTTSKAAGGQSYWAMSTSAVASLTPRACASARALACAAGEKSIDRTSSPCSATHTPLRPSPSAMASARPRGGSRSLLAAKKTLGAVPKMYSGAAKRPSHRAYSLIGESISPAAFPRPSCRGSRRKSVGKHGRFQQGRQRGDLLAGERLVGRIGIAGRHADQVHRRLHDRRQPAMHPLGRKQRELQLQGG